MTRKRFAHLNEPASADADADFGRVAATAMSKVRPPPSSAKSAKSPANAERPREQGSAAQMKAALAKVGRS